MKYLGKKKLYKFLIEHGFIVSELKKCVYKRFFGEETLFADGLECICQKKKKIYITTFKYDFKTDLFLGFSYFLYENISSFFVL